MIDNTADASNERKLAVETPVTINDGGANGSVTIGLTTVPGTKGGTGHATTTTGDILVGTSGNAWAKMGLGGALEVLRVNAAGTGLEYAAAGTGSVTDFSAGDLSPLFTTSEATTTTTPALTFTLSNAAANTAFGNFTGGAAQPSFGTVSIGAGGTGQTSATAAFDALAPTTTQGDLIYYNGSDNVRLAKGTANQVVGMNSGATAPEYKSVVAGTGITVNHTANQIEIVNSTLGTVTNFSAGDLSPLFTTSEATTTSTPALSFTLSNAAAYSVFGNNTSGSAAPAYQTMVTQQLPSGAVVFGGTGGSSSARAIPTSGTLTGEYWHNGNWATTNTITCNQCRLHVVGTVTISHAITVSNEIDGGTTGTAQNGSSGSGAGLAPGQAPNHNTGSSPSGGGGGGNGGAGGIGGGYATGCGGRSGRAIKYEHFLPGSSGGAGEFWTSGGGSGGNGGGALLIEATDAILVDGNITATGGNGGTGAGARDGGGGGGAGGTVALITQNGNITINASKTVNVSGGNGGGGGATQSAGGGGGGGGRFFARAGGGGTYTNNGTVTVSGGSAGTGVSSGQAAAAGSAGVTDTASGVTYSVRTAP